MKELFDVMQSRGVVMTEQGYLLPTGEELIWSSGYTSDGLRYPKYWKSDHGHWSLYKDKEIRRQFYELRAAINYAFSTYIYQADVRLLIDFRSETNNYRADLRHKSFRIVLDDDSPFWCYVSKAKDGEMPLTALWDFLNEKRLFD